MVVGLAFADDDERTEFLRELVEILEKTFERKTFDEVPISPLGAEGSPHTQMDDYLDAAKAARRISKETPYKSVTPPVVLDIIRRWETMRRER